MVIRNTLKIEKVIFLILAFFVISFNSCDLVDPTEVKNPSITEENLLENATGGAAPVITSLKSKLAGNVSWLAQVTDVTSDNYQNISVNISGDLDQVRTVVPADISVLSPYLRLMNQYALANFGLDVVIPKDKNATTNQRAEIIYYKGMALLLLAENWSAFPLEANAAPVSSAAANKMAIEQFKTALDLSTDNAVKTNCRYALARAYRLDGDKANADAEAKAVLALNAEYLYQAQYDAVNLTNTVQFYVLTRNAYDMQPLPRLDFLDPKYTNATNTSPIAIHKAEELHLILAEVAIANNDLASAKKSLTDAIALAKKRPTVQYLDNEPRLLGAWQTVGFNNASYKVKASANAPAIGGLIIKRPGTSLLGYPVSGTSLNINDIDALTTKTEIIRALYLLRQEILFLEGRRMSDLGIRLPVPRQQVDNNDVLRPASDPNNNSIAGTRVYVPDFIPQGRDMDNYSVDVTAGVVTIKNDMNQIVADNYDKIKQFK